MIDVTSNNDSIAFGIKTTIETRLEMLPSTSRIQIILE